MTPLDDLKDSVIDAARELSYAFDIDDGDSYQSCVRDLVALVRAVDELEAFEREQSTKASEDAAARFAADCRRDIPRGAKR